MGTVCAIAGAIVAGMLTIGVAAAQTDAAPAASDAAAAAPAKPAAKAKPKKMAKPMMAKVSVTISNTRTVGLTDLQAGESGTGAAKKIAGPLAAGKKTVVSIAHGKTCLFDLSAVYDDGSTMDAAGVDLCTDKKLNLVE
jgi:hypothetical protein